MASPTEPRTQAERLEVVVEALRRFHDLRANGNLASRGEMLEFDYPVSGGDIATAVARKLLAENVRMILGAWQVNQSPDEYLVVYSAQVNAAGDAATLQKVIEVVMFSADRIEKQLSDKDVL